MFSVYEKTKLRNCAFVLATYLYDTSPLYFLDLNFKSLAIFCCTARFVSDLVGTRKTGFLAAWLNIDILAV